MSLSVGSTIGPYRVLSRLGEGGMGVVFRARDTRLERDVAIKTLPDVFAHDPDRLERFEREAQVLASLNHPHIAQIFGFERSADECYIAMELVEGETLADRLVHGSIPVEETLSIAGEIAEALEAAHEKGVVHRDLKPGNIKLTLDGQIKVLDFGLAKAMSEEAHAALVSHSPTISPAATQAGVILGTAAYMAPEQARGRAVDRRADIWAFGVVVFEMLTGRTLYSGDTTSETLAHVMMTEPNWQSLPHGTPPALVQLLRRCLVKDPRNRLQAIGDARIELVEISTGATEPRPAPRSSLGWYRLLGWSLASAMLGASVSAAVIVVWSRGGTAAPAVSRWTIQLAQGERIAGGNVVGGLGIGRPSITISPDERHIVYVVERNNQTMLHVRALREFEGKPIPGTEGGFQPFFSPDGQWVGFFTDTKLKKVFLQGGAPVTLADAVHVYGASWASNDRIYYGDREGHKLTRIAASVGTPEVIANSTSVGVQLLWPHVLPGARAMLFNSLSPGVISVLSLEDGKHRPLITGTSATYVATGHLVFSRGSDVLAAPFDLDRLAVTGPAVPVLQNVRTEALDAGQFSISTRGTLAYVPGGFARHVQLVWLDRQGSETPVNVPSQVYGAFELSPDGRRVVIVVPAQGEGQTNDVWIYDLERDTRTRLTARGAIPIWTPDGKSIIFGSEGGA